MQKTGDWVWIYRPLVAGFLAGLAVLLLPLLIARGDEPEQPPTLLPTQTVPSPSPEPPVAQTWDEAQTVRILLESGAVEEMTLKEYLWRVVAAEMPASFEQEALRAQAVCARTYTLWKMERGIHPQADLCDGSTCCQAYTTREEAAARWEDLAEVYATRISAAVADTDGQLILFEGKPIQAVFFSSSVPSTEDAAAVWGSSLPYLVSVPSPEGEEVPNYRSTVTLTAEELRTLVANSGMGLALSGKPSSWLGNISYNASGRVAEMSVGGVTISGGAARTMFGLRSTCFEVNEKDGVFTFSVTGYGHGVGMSQYGANTMAKQGGSWQEIIEHYYTGVTVQKGI